MKVLQILYSGLGGHGSVVFSFLEHEHTLSNELIFYGVDDLKTEYISKCESLEIPFYYVKKKENKILKPWTEIFAILYKARPDRVILHDPKLIVPIGLYCKLFNIKFIVVEHTPNQVKTPAEKWATKQSMKYADEIVLLTESYYHELKHILKNRFKREKITIIPNGINTSLFEPTNLGTKITKTIGMAARFSRTKNQKVLIDAFEKVAMIHPDAKLLFAGDGETFNETKSYISSKKYKDQIILLGNLEESELLDFYNKISLYVHASHGETMSTSIMQALACGLPIIASDIPGINNVIEHDKNGLLFNSESELTDLLERLLSADQIYLLDKLSRNARETAISRFSSHKMYESYMQLLR